MHSFREGNTRTQFVFFSELCEQAGYRLDTEAFRVGNPLREEFVDARFHSQDTGRNDRLAAVLDKAITQPPPPPGRGSGDGPTRGPSQGPALRAASFPRAPSVTARSTYSSPAGDDGACGGSDRAQRAADGPRMTSSRFVIEERWPELFEDLDPTQRWAVVQSLAASWHEGWVPNRADVVLLADHARGAIDDAEYVRRAAEVAQQERREQL